MYQGNDCTMGEGKKEKGGKMKIKEIITQHKTDATVISTKVIYDCEFCGYREEVYGQDYRIINEIICPNCGKKSDADYWWPPEGPPDSGY